MRSTCNRHQRELNEPECPVHYSGGKAMDCNRKPRIDALRRPNGCHLERMLDGRRDPRQRCADLRRRREATR
jgi:hypothetical protein